MKTYKAYTDKYDYPQTEAITLEGIGRLYQTPVGWCPSITTVLSKTKTNTGLEEWRERVGAEEADAITKAAGEKGTSVHELMEFYLKGIDYSPLLTKANRLVITGFNSLKLYRKNITEIWGQEVFLYDEELRVAGRTDLIGMWDGIPSVIDWKTSRKPKKPEWIIDYKFQTLFYKLCHDKMFGTDIRQGVILIAVENDLPQRFIVDFYSDENAWLWNDLGTRFNNFFQGPYLDEIMNKAGLL